MRQNEDAGSLKASVEGRSTLSDQIETAERLEAEGIHLRQVSLPEGVSLLDIARRYGDLYRR